MPQPVQAGTDVERQIRDGQLQEGGDVAERDEGDSEGFGHGDTLLTHVNTSMWLLP